MVLSETKLVCLRFGIGFNTECSLKFAKLKGENIMQINLKAPDVYQVQAAPTNENDVKLNMFGMACGTLMALGLLAFAFFGIHKSKGGK